MLDLHGNLKKKEVTPDGSKDENVFDIEQGVAIGLFVKKLPRPDELSSPRVSHAECWGARAEKYDWLLANDLASAGWVDSVSRPAFYLFKPFGTAGTAEYDNWHSVKDVFPVNSVGIVTARDALAVQWSAESVWDVVSDVAQSDAEVVRKKYRLGRDVLDWRVESAQEDLRRAGPSQQFIVPVMYRPFDTRFTYYTGQSRGFICRPRAEVMRHMLAVENIALIACRQQARGDDEWAQVFATTGIAESCAISNITREINYVFPLYCYPRDEQEPGRGGLLDRWTKGKHGRTPNLAAGFVERIANAADLRFISDGVGDLRKTLGPEDIGAWIYAVFHSPRYRERYEAQLKLDFPRVPLPGCTELFRMLAGAGHELLAQHLLKAPSLNEFVTSYTGPNSPQVDRPGWSDGTVWLDAAKTAAREGHRARMPGTIGFTGVPEKVWDFQVGGYQVCHKWLKDRKGRTLSDEDVAHYRRIIASLNETIRMMSEIDEIIEAHGGWPGAFNSGAEAG